MGGARSRGCSRSLRHPSNSDPSSPTSNLNSNSCTCCADAQLRRGPWTAEEDELLLRHMRSHGDRGNWRKVPKAAGLMRCGKSCRLRWLNYLRPDLKRGGFSDDEDALIIKLHSLLGNRWSLIAGRIPGRSDNEIKNYWNFHLGKKLLKLGINPKTHKPLTSSPVPVKTVEMSSRKISKFCHSLSFSPISSSVTDDDDDICSIKVEHSSPISRTGIDIQISSSIDDFAGIHRQYEEEDQTTRTAATRTCPSPFNQHEQQTQTDELSNQLAMVTDDHNNTVMELAYHDQIQLRQSFHSAANELEMIQTQVLMFDQVAPFCWLPPMLDHSEFRCHDSEEGNSIIFGDDSGYVHT